MNFQDLHEQLRLELLRRIDAGHLTGTSLARQVRFKQGHISNVLNRKRFLSLEGLDRVLAAQNIRVDQLIAVDLSASVGENAGPDSIPVVSQSAAMDEAVVHPSSVIETVQVSASRLQDGRSESSPRQAHWQRFVAIRVDAHQAAAMDPVLVSGAIAVLDRHYNSLAHHRPHQRNLYAVRSGGGLALRYVEFDNGKLILRPLSAAFPIQLIDLSGRQTPADYLVGRVCVVIAEL